MQRLGGLWEIDLIRHATLSALTAAAITTGVLLAATGIESGSERFDRSGPLVESAAAIDERNRDAARTAGAEQGRRQGRLAAEQDLTNLSAIAGQSAGYDSGYEQGWNLVIRQSSGLAPLQLRAGADGTQWIELLR